MNKNGETFATNFIFHTSLQPILFSVQVRNNSFFISFTTIQEREREESTPQVIKGKAQGSRVNCRTKIFFGIRPAAAAAASFTQF